MKRKNHDHENPIAVRAGTTNTQAELPEYDCEDISLAVKDGIEQASKEVILAALCFWARRGASPDDEIIRFLAHTTKEVITGEIQRWDDVAF